MEDRRAQAEEGATAVEYALLIALIASVIFATVLAFGIAVGELFDNQALRDALSP